jgi:hypothetical protein
MPWLSLPENVRPDISVSLGDMFSVTLWVETLAPQEPPSDDYNTLTSGPPVVTVRYPRVPDQQHGCSVVEGVTVLLLLRSIVWSIIDDSEGLHCSCVMSGSPCTIARRKTWFH